MKRIRAFTGIFALVVLTMVLTACGKSEFGLTENTEKKMTITAERAKHMLIHRELFSASELHESAVEPALLAGCLQASERLVLIVGISR